jgi:hypothetical protein
MKAVALLRVAGGGMALAPIEQQRGLRCGLSLEQVRELLAGWNDQPILATESTKVLDFNPPTGLEVRTVRLTFVNNELTIWASPRRSGN